MDWELIKSLVIYKNNERIYLSHNVENIEFDLKNDDTQLVMHIKTDEEEISDD